MKHFVNSLVKAVCTQVDSVEIRRSHLQPADKRTRHHFRITSSKSFVFLMGNNIALLTQSSHEPLGFLVLYSSRRSTRIWQAFCTAAPLRSEEAEAAVGLVLGTVLVLVSEMWIFEQGTPRTRLATCETRRQVHHPLITCSFRASDSH